MVICYFYLKAINKISISDGRFVLVSVGIGCAIHLTMGVWRQWQDSPVVMGLKVGTRDT